MELLATVALVWFGFSVPVALLLGRRLAHVSLAVPVRHIPVDERAPAPVRAHEARATAFTVGSP